MPQPYVKFKFAWWLKVYVCGVHFASFITGCQPDFSKVARYYCLAIRVKKPL